MKGVFSKMFKSNDLKIVNSNINISSEMIDKIEQWYLMLQGKAKWCKDDIVSLRIEQGICQEFANVVTSEMDLKISDESMQKDITYMLRNLNENLQDGLGQGSFIMRSLGGKKVEYITPQRFIPIEFDANGNLVDVYIIETKDIKEVRYYRFERHSIKDGYLSITNQAFKGTKSKIESLIRLDYIEEWSMINEFISYPAMKKIDIGYYRNPIKNNIDGSFIGVSVFDSAIDKIEKVDTQYGRLDWEYESAERAIHVDDMALKNSNIPTRKKKVYRGLGLTTGMGTDLFKEFSPALRDDAYIRGLNEYLRRIEFDVSLAYGDLSKIDTVEKTATEIKAAKQKKYSMVNAIETNLESCLLDFIDGYAFYNKKFTSGYEVSISFKDSILTSEETERMQDIQDVNLGIMQKWEYRMKWYNEDETTAKQNVQQETEQGLEYGS